MTRDELLATLVAIKARGGLDHEADHVDADDALLLFINDAEVTTAYSEIEMWYA